MYWIYNICLVAYWILQIPILVYRLLFEEGFYERLKQSAGIMPTPTLEKIAYHHAIWVHAASVGEVVAASPIIRELKKTTLEAPPLSSLSKMTRSIHHLYAICLHLIPYNNISASEPILNV